MADVLKATREEKLLILGTLAKVGAKGCQVKTGVLANKRGV